MKPERLMSTLCRRRAIAKWLLLPLAARSAYSFSQRITLSNVEQHTENRSWNEVGVSPTYQILVSVSIVPPGFPTLVFAERGDERHPLTHLATQSAPSRYVLWLRFEQARAGPWRIVATRGDVKSAPVFTHGVARPWQVPYVNNLRVTGKGTSPLVSWTMPDFSGHNIQRIRVGIRGGQRVQGRFLDVLYLSDALPTTATRFSVPQGILTAGERYVFQVMLENLDDGELKNRSLTFSDPYTVARQ